MIAIVDYGMGNLKSVANALTMLGCVHAIATTPAAIARCDKVIIPGVGAFSQAVENLRESGLFAALCRHVDSGKPLLGICLGMQLLCRESTEDGLWQGFGWLDARVVRLTAAPPLKIPHMGWNSLRFVRGDGLFDNIRDVADAYFVHSYYVECEDSADVLAYTEHGIEFASVVRRGHVFGVQFHPEKSQHVGIELLKNFSAI